MTPQFIAICVLSIACAYCIGRWLFTADQEVVARRKAAAQLAAKLQTYGLIILPRMLSEYSIGDYAGLVKEIENQVVLFLGPNGDAALLKELQASFDSVLSAQLATPTGLAYVQAKIANAAKAQATPTAPTT